MPPSTLAPRPSTMADELVERLARVDGVGDEADRPLALERREVAQAAGPARALADEEQAVGPPADHHDVGLVQGAW